MNEVLNTFLSAGDSAMSKQHLRQPGFTRSACGPFSKDKKVMQNLNYVALLRIYLKEQRLIKYYLI